ncbi:2-polyprenyl-6-methoxyphenol hydroxylase [Legionella busanensis]|uniref:2-polyprenyl-6-methoxyphenol hydroxylase n=1 Tax=Legionella busanensis TaxID=190655 RepID=A0A378JIC9_9GAMM|nr:FAD-dependent monooxygenase [Legionella busanensis]STX49979.1 2-polyprenyl-6-methoxyphenol hydroxylase [Legionella busanensis]
MKSHQFDVIVAGGGVIGLTAALAMAERNFSVALLDAGDLEINALAKPDLRVYAINHASQNLLKQLGAWELIDLSRVSPYQHMYVWDAVTLACIEFDARLIASSNLGTIIEETIIKNALLKRLANEQKVTLFPKHKITQVNSTSELITLISNEEIWQSNLLLVTDGANSPIRKMLGTQITSWPYHQHALVTTVRTEKPHQETAYQVFNPDGPLAFLPLVDKNLCSIVWSTTPQQVNQLITLEDERFNEALSKAFAYKLGQAHVVSTRHQFPLTMRHTKQYVGKNWLLLGDAAHTIHPLAGLGLNVGLADISTWLNCLDKSAGKNFSTNVLNAYQRQRKYAVWQVIALMGGLKTLFANPLTPVATLRQVGLTFCNQFTPLKRLFIEQAVGQSLK